MSSEKLLLTIQKCTPFTYFFFFPLTKPQTVLAYYVVMCCNWQPTRGQSMCPEISPFGWLCSLICNNWNELPTIFIFPVPPPSLFFPSPLCVLVALKWIDKLLGSLLLLLILPGVEIKNFFYKWNCFQDFSLDVQDLACCILKIYTTIF